MNFDIKLIIIKAGWANTVNPFVKQFPTPPPHPKWSDFTQLKRTSTARDYYSVLCCVLGFVHASS